MVTFFLETNPYIAWLLLAVACLSLMKNIYTVRRSACVPSSIQAPTYVLLMLVTFPRRKPAKTDDQNHKATPTCVKRFGIRLRPRAEFDGERKWDPRSWDTCHALGNVCEKTCWMILTYSALVTNISHVIRFLSRKQIIFRCGTVIFRRPLYLDAGPLHANWTSRQLVFGTPLAQAFSSPRRQRRSVCPYHRRPDSDTDSDSAADSSSTLPTAVHDQWL
jgi:hypothetical protein